MVEFESLLGAIMGQETEQEDKRNANLSVLRVASIGLGQHPCSKVLRKDLGLSYSEGSGGVVYLVIVGYGLLK